MSVSHAEFTLERRYGHTPAQVFSAFADPALKERWFASASSTATTSSTTAASSRSR